MMVVGSSLEHGRFEMWLHSRSEALIHTRSRLLWLVRAAPLVGLSACSLQSPYIYMYCQTTSPFSNNFHCTQLLEDASTS